MKTNKILYISIGVAVFFIMLTVGILVIGVGKSSNGKMTKGIEEVVRSYIGSINSGKYDEAYNNLSYMSTGYINQEDFSELMNVFMDEKDIRVEVDETKNVQELSIANGDSSLTCMDVPINRIYSEPLDGENTVVKEELSIGIIEEEGKYKVYIPEELYYDYVVKYILGKANECAIEALENKNMENIVAENSAKIDQYLNFAQMIPSTYKNYSEVALQIDLISAYKMLAEGDKDNALNKVQSSYSIAETKEQKIKVCRVESEMYYASGQYAQAVDVLKKALDEVDPTNEDLRRDYRRINSMMLEQIESSLTRGWSQVQSAIKQEEKEMDRILSDIALVEAENAIKIKEDAPDGYYLKGNIEYCLGDYHSAIESLEKAVELSTAEDNEFKTKAAEILGMARVASASNKEERDMGSYQQVFDKDVRSILFRGNEVSGIVDTIK